MLANTIINIPTGDRKKNRWMSHNNFQNHMTAQLPFSMSHSYHFLGHSNGTKILTKMLYLRQWHNARSKPEYDFLQYEYDDSAEVRGPYIVWIRHLGMFWPNSLRGWVFNYAKNCPAHSALATADPWEHWAHCSRSLLGMSPVSTLFEQHDFPARANNVSSNNSLNRQRLEFFYHYCATL